MPGSSGFEGVLIKSQQMGQGAASQAVLGRFDGRLLVNENRKQGF